MASNEAVIAAVRHYAMNYFNGFGQGVYTWDLEKQGLGPEDYANWNIEKGRVIHAIKAISIIETESNPEQGQWLVSVNAEPEVADVQLFEVSEHDDGTLLVCWHGC